MLREFEPLSMDWFSYKLLLDTFFRLFEIDRIDRKIQLMRKLGGRRLRKALSESRLLRDEDDTRADTRVFDMLREAFHKPDEIWLKRLEFKSQRQGEEETGPEFLSRLQTLAKGCHFHEDSERVCEQFLDGIRSDDLRNRLMLEPPEKLSASTISETARLWESTLSDHSCDFSKFEAAVLQLCKRYPERAATDPASKSSSEASRTSKRGAPPEPKDPGINGIEPSVLICGNSVEATRKTRASRKRSMPSVTTPRSGGKGARERKADHERRESDDAQNVIATATDTKQSPGRQTKADSAKKRGRPLSTAYVPGGKRYKCGHCEYMSDIKRSVLRHERIHTGDRPYKCQFCELRFREKHHVQNHERVHTGETPYICEYCGRGFSKSSTLTDHVRTHTREAPHLCEFCGRGFIQKSALNTHKLIHTGLRPHSCTLCLRGFTTSNLLRTHMKTHASAAYYREDSTRAEPDQSFPILDGEPYPVSLSAAGPRDRSLADVSHEELVSPPAFTDSLCREGRSHPS